MPPRKGLPSRVTNTFRYGACAAILIVSYLSSYVLLSSMGSYGPGVVSKGVWVTWEPYGMSNNLPNDSSRFLEVMFFPLLRLDRNHWHEHKCLGPAERD